MKTANFQVGAIIGEYRDLSQSVMTLDQTGHLVLLASKHSLSIVDLTTDDISSNKKTTRRKNVKWEVHAAQWNPHSSKKDTFVVTRNHVADVFVHSSDGKFELISTLQFHQRAITDLDWSPFSESLLLSCGAGGNACLWDIRTSTSPAQMFETLQSCSASQVKWNKVRKHTIKQ